jgi:rubrerythrin
MSEKSAVDVLKNAILLERQGRAFYRKVAEQTNSDAVKRFFNIMAEEEMHHEQMLSQQFKALQETHKFDAESLNRASAGAGVSQILSEEIQWQISAATFEAAAIAAAMAMEKNAVALYAGRAEQTQDTDEKMLYEWLADWERSHLDFLAKLDRELTEKIWNDNSFWPF